MVTAIPSGDISWVICGGESGHGARPFDLAWARSLRDQCSAANTRFFFKQMGARAIDSSQVDLVGSDGKVHYVRPVGHHDHQEALRTGGYTARPHVLVYNDRAGTDTAEWPEDLRIQEFPR